MSDVQTAVQQLADIEKQSLSIVTACIEGLQQAAGIVQSHQVCFVTQIYSCWFIILAMSIARSSKALVWCVSVLSVF